MTNSQCYIGRVRSKNGGADLRIFPDGNRKRTKATLDLFQKSANLIREHFDDDCSGYVIVAWNSKSTWGSQVFCDQSSRVNRNTLPEFVAEAMRRDNAELEARMVLENL